MGESEQSFDGVRKYKKMQEQQLEPCSRTVTTISCVGKKWVGKMHPCKERRRAVEDGEVRSRDRGSEPSTSRCCSCDATAPACHNQFLPGGPMCVPHRARSQRWLRHPQKTRKSSQRARGYCSGPAAVASHGDRHECRIMITLCPPAEPPQPGLPADRPRQAGSAGASAGHSPDVMQSRRPARTDCA